MNQREIAASIPGEYRREILQMNLIDKAQAVAADPSMHYLATIWKNYIDPTFTPDCPLCYGRVLNHFKALKLDFIELEKQANLLKEA